LLGVAAALRLDKSKLLSAVAARDLTADADSLLPFLGSAVRLDRVSKIGWTPSLAIGADVVVCGVSSSGAPRDPPIWSVCSPAAFVGGWIFRRRGEFHAQSARPGSPCDRRGGAVIVTSFALTEGTRLVAVVVAELIAILFAAVISASSR
jgi:hypothetical protein